MHSILLTDVDVMTHGLLKYNFFGHEVWLTTTHVSLLIVVLILMGFCVVAGQKLKKATEVPDGFQNLIELMVEKLDGMVDSSMDRHAPKYYNYIGTIFVFIVFSNISGLIGLRPPTADYGVTLPLALVTFVLIHFQQFKTQTAGEIWEGLTSPLPTWLPLWVPINLISEFAVPVSLSLRLFANVLSGTIMMALVYGLLGWLATIWPAALHVYFDLFSGCIQTYVFCMLTMTYIRSNITDRD